jgi:hypothetical protein
MEMELKIPSDDFESLIELLNLSDSEFDSIVKDIEKISVDSDFKSIETKLQDITSNYKVILGLYFTFCKFDMHENKFAMQLSNYYKQMTDDDSVDSKLVNRIQDLFKKDNPIRIAIKSKTLFTEVANIYNDSRILSDIRPVFSSKEENSLIGKVILNNLKINYRTDNDYKEFFVTLNVEDLLELRDVIDRAIQKTEILKSSNL